MQVTSSDLQERVMSLGLVGCGILIISINITFSISKYSYAAGGLTILAGVSTLIKTNYIIYYIPVFSLLCLIISVNLMVSQSYLPGSAIGVISIFMIFRSYQIFGDIY